MAKEPPIFLARKWILALLIVIYGIMAVTYFAGLHDWVGIENESPFGADFINLWSGARLTLEGHILTLFDRTQFWQTQNDIFGHRIEFHTWSYPPHLIPWILWLGVLPYVVAFAAWNLVTFALYAWSVVYKRSSPWGLTLILALAPSSIENLADGQMGFLTAALLIGGLRLLEERPLLSGVLFGFLTFKPQMGLLVPVALLAGRRWNTIFAAVLTVIVLVALSILCYGMEPWRIFSEMTIPYQRTILEAAPEQLFSSMMTSPFMAVRDLGGSLVMAYAVAILVALSAAGIVFYAFFRPLPLEIRNCILLTATFLCSPYMFCYDMPALSAAVITMFIIAGRSLSPDQRTLLCAAWVLPLLIFRLDIVALPVTPLICAGLIWVQLQWAGRSAEVANRLSVY